MGHEHEPDAAATPPAEPPPVPQRDSPAIPPAEPPPTAQPPTTPPPTPPRASPPPTPPPTGLASAPNGDGSSRSPDRRWVLLAVLALLVVAAAVVGRSMLTDDDSISTPQVTSVTTLVTDPSAPTTAGGTTTPATTSPEPEPTTTAPPTTATPTTPLPTTPPPTTTPPTAPPDPTDEYVGLVYRSELPVGVDWIGGALIGDDFRYAVTWVETPQGEMFWFERETEAPLVDGRPEFEVIDAVLVPPPVEQDASDQVILGGTLCEVDGAERYGVVGIFQLSGAEWLDVMLHGWFADTASGRLVPATGTVRCIDEAFGV